jgi:ribosomal protein L30E
MNRLSLELPAVNFSGEFNSCFNNHHGTNTDCVTSCSTMAVLDQGDSDILSQEA